MAHPKSRKKEILVLRKELENWKRKVTDLEGRMDNYGKQIATIRGGESGDKRRVSRKKKKRKSDIGSY